MKSAADFQTVVEMTRSIPCAPAILPKLLQLTEGSASDLGELEMLISLDTGLATSVLRTSNSAYFGGTQRCDNIADAILRIPAADLSIFMHARFAQDGDYTILTTGLPASPGATSGRIVTSAEAAVDAAEECPGECIMIEPYDQAAIDARGV